MNESEKKYDITHSIILLNSCTNCDRKFKPKKVW